MGKPAKHSSPFDRFQQLTKALTAVPRKELQAKLDKYEREKAKEKNADSIVFPKLWLRTSASAQGSLTPGIFIHAALIGHSQSTLNRQIGHRMTNFALDA
jgi:hypothetical protein